MLTVLSRAGVDRPMPVGAMAATVSFLASREEFHADPNQSYLQIVIKKVVIKNEGRQST